MSTKAVSKSGIRNDKKVSEIFLYFHLVSSLLDLSDFVQLLFLDLFLGRSISGLFWPLIKGSTSFLKNSKLAFLNKPF